MDAESQQQFDRMAQCVVDEYDKFAPVKSNPALTVDGSQTQGENIGGRASLATPAKRRPSCLQTTAAFVRPGTPSRLMSRSTGQTIGFPTSCLTPTVQSSSSSSHLLACRFDSRAAFRRHPPSPATIRRLPPPSAIAHTIADLQLVRIQSDARAPHKAGARRPALAERISRLWHAAKFSRLSSRIQLQSRYAVRTA